MIAQGAALGTISPVALEALKGRHYMTRQPYRALSELHTFVGMPSQGCALGYHLLPFQGNDAD
jgi:hypothetical protein